jgi:UDP-N-acetylglucosamine:LPS N-acetylglucosamine transferase
MSLNPQLEQTFKLDKQFLEESHLPIITVSASYKEDLKGLHGLPEDESLTDIVFSRAHYSMALAVAVEAWGNKLDHKKAWILDPTNYVSRKDWRSIELTEVIGKTLARHPILKKLKDLVDKFGRSKLPILPSITPPLLHVTKDLDCPILSLHIASGNILAGQGKKIVQVITDPHVRDEYLNNAEKPNIKFCVFDEKTKTEFLEKAVILGKKVNPKKVVVTGPPVDPRIIKARSKKQAWRNGPINLCLSTGGLGTNKSELRKILKKLLPLLRKKPQTINLCLYAGTHEDIFKMAQKLAQQEHIKAHIISDLNHPDYFDKVGTSLLEGNKFSIIYHPQIVDANEILIKHAFSWADGFITKPSGDMAYDATAAGCFTLTLQEWGEWEHNIREVFEQKGVARKAEVDHIDKQLEALSDSKGKNHSWIEGAMRKALTIDKLFISGTKNIIKASKTKCD